MFKIGDFSRLGQVSTRMLRHYDQLGLLAPKEVDRWTGYRYYTIDQLGDLNRIIALKELGFTLEQVKDLVEAGDRLPAEQLRGMLTLRKAEIERTLQEEEARLARVEARLRQIELEGQPTPYEVVVKAIPALTVASIRQVVPHVDEMNFYCHTMYQQLYRRLRQLGITPLQPEITFYHTEEYRESDLEVEAAVPVQPKVLRQGLQDDLVALRHIPGHDLAGALIYEGAYDEIIPAVLSLLTWIGASEHVPAGPMRELHLSGPAHPDGKHVVPSAVLELQLPIQPIERPHSPLP